LPYYVQKHDPLNSFSAFRYEHYLKELKKSIKCAKYPLQKVSNRVIEKYNEINNTAISQIKYPLFQKEKQNNDYSCDVSEIAYLGTTNYTKCNIDIIIGIIVLKIILGEL